MPRNILAGDLTVSGYFVFFCVIVFSIVINIFTVTDNIAALNMAQTGLLVISNLSRIPKILASVRNHVSQTLYISFAPTTHLPTLSYGKHIAGIYNQTTKVCDNLDVHVLMENLKNPLIKEIKTVKPVEIVIFDQHSATSELNDYVRRHVSNLEKEFSVINMEEADFTSNAEPTRIHDSEEVYDYVALGGTFDRLHTGHKILLSEGILRARKHLTVGVTDINMIKSKKLWELIEPVELRINNLIKFLKDVDPSLEYNVVPIQDIYGPTKDDPKLQLLVVSQETIKGGEKVNEKRQENNLNPMAVYCIELASENQKESSEEEAKISSSNRRMRLLGSVFREPKDNPDIPALPYVIGLTGGIASGKTKISERLRDLGAGVVNCDLLAHELYKAGQPMNATIAQTFGQDVLDGNGEINRQKLGQIVFNDSSRLSELNNLLWPAIINLARKRVKQLGDEGYRVVVMEAAVLIQAKWEHTCHQVWTSIIPREEAVKRLHERNGLTTEAAVERLDSQPSNSDQVAAANVIFSSYWSYDFTSCQVTKAWNNLIKYLDAKNIK